MAKRTTAVASKKTEDDVLAAAMARVQQQQDGEDDDTEIEEPVVAAPASKAKKASVPTVTEKTVPRSKAKTVKVCYTPLDREDPSFTIFFGMKFDANVEREVTNPELIKLAMQNPWFKVDGKHHAKRTKPPKREDDDQGARSGLPEGVSEKEEVEATSDDFK